ncbi:Guanine nucleotide-binding protein subunit gamma-1 [Camponotus floridanus]|uniref:Guanine nucleotide-binding protein subunit gamma-1 n=2 Tax=Camponotus floridanus TaxID=104421 RepID=E2A4E0_CAMFO|nr:Guanine nucleotide-binding protein subunit gamma-1 [Camponotus floridanus]
MTKGAEFYKDALVSQSSRHVMRRNRQVRDCLEGLAYRKDLRLNLHKIVAEAKNVDRKKVNEWLFVTKKRIELLRPRFAICETVMDMVITNLQQQRLVTEQLRREAALKRITVSKAVEDIMKYITEHEQEDCLLLGFSSQKSNPFREKSTCILL